MTTRWNSNPGTVDGARRRPRVLVFLPAGDATLTRRAKAASGRSAVAVRWSRSRKRDERQGVLVEEAALEQASSGSRYGTNRLTVEVVPGGQ